MLRVTIKDAEQIISFPTTEEILRRLVAGCAANPVTGGELLLATEVFQHGIAKSVMTQLMEFDKALQRQGPAFIHRAIEDATESEEALDIAFQVIDEQTEAEAFTPRRCDLVVLDLTERTIRTSDGVEIEDSGEILAHTGERLTDRSITYFLPKEWSIIPI